MPYEVLLTTDAQRDLEEIHDHIASRDAPEKAEHVLERMEAVLAKLAAFPERGSLPRNSWPSESATIGKRISNRTA